MMSRKILVLLGHPDKSGFCGEMADTYEAAARAAGHEVDRLDLGEMRFDDRDGSDGSPLGPGADTGMREVSPAPSASTSRGEEASGRALASRLFLGTSSRETGPVRTGGATRGIAGSSCVSSVARTITGRAGAPPGADKGGGGSLSVLCRAIGPVSP